MPGEHGLVDHDSSSPSSSPQRPEEDTQSREEGKAKLDERAKVSTRGLLPRRLVLWSPLLVLGRDQHHTWYLQRSLQSREIENIGEG